MKLRRPASCSPPSPGHPVYIGTFAEASPRMRSEETQFLGPDDPQKAARAFLYENVYNMLNYCSFFGEPSRGERFSAGFIPNIKCLGEQVLSGSTLKPLVNKGMVSL